MEHHRTNDVLHVNHLLGLKNTKNILVYTHIVDFRDNEYVSQVATKTEDAQQYIEAGFDYVLTTPEDLMLLRKRK